MTDTKREVSEAAKAAMTAACDVIGNRDIEHMTSHIIRSFTHPDEVPEIMHALAGVTFVQSVQSPALAMVVPLLMKGLRSRITATRRQSAVIIDNMSKLVDDPIDAAPFLPLLMPALERAADAMSDPEARKVAESAAAQLNRLSALCEAAKAGNKTANKDLVLAAIKAKVPSATPEQELALSHVSGLCCSLMGLRKFSAEDWSEISRYLAGVIGDSAAAQSVVDLLRPECKEMVKIVVVADDDDDDAEELCNCQFTLAYGTKILLHNTTMRLKRGHKYGLLGGNDSGKTTLMRSIANGSVEGFPDPSTGNFLSVLMY
jgi:elongation factor 3